MSLYSTNLAALRLNVKHVLQMSTDAQLLDVDDLINQSLVEFWSIQAWPWRQRSVSLDTVSAQNYVALPADLAQLDALYAAGSLTGQMIPCTIDELVRMRAVTAIDSALMYWYAVDWTPQASATALPVPRLELFPTPSESATGAFTGYYTRTPAKLSADTDVPDMPQAMQPLFVSYARLRAMQQAGMLDQAAQLQPSVDRMIAAGMNETGGIQRNLGRMRGVGTAREAIVQSPPVINYP